MCDEWLNSIAAFYADMGERPAGMTLERRNNDEGYCKENCLWATMVQQARNRRSSLIVEYRGRAMCLKAWAEELGISYNAVFARLRMGWTVEEAFEEPVGNNKNRRTSLILEYRGRSMCLADWSRELGIANDTLRARLKSGWSVEKAFTEPLTQPGKRPKTAHTNV